MKRRKALLTRAELKAGTILKKFPGPVPYSRRREDNYSLSGAYLMCRGLVGDDDGDESVRFPQPGELSGQLVKDNPLLGLAAFGLVKNFADNPQVLLADLFAEAIQWAEDATQTRLATRLLDYALFLSKKQVTPNSPPLKTLRYALFQVNGGDE